LLEDGLTFNLGNIHSITFVVPCMAFGCNWHMLCFVGRPHPSEDSETMAATLEAYTMVPPEKPSMRPLFCIFDVSFGGIFNLFLCWHRFFFFLRSQVDCNFFQVLTKCDSKISARLLQISVNFHKISNSKWPQKYPPLY
jgi:hypothetical protein